MKYYFNEDSEEEKVISSGMETHKIKSKPKITSVHSVQIKLPRLTSSEINKAMHSETERHEELNEIKESTLKIKR